jgi:addiction module RelE/StbE family toxin
MKFKITYTNLAESDLERASDYISQELHNKTAAKKLILAARESARSLSEMPTRHPVVSGDFLAEREIRSIPVKNYMMFYTMHEETKTVSIVRFLYGKRDWRSLLRGDEI